MEQGLSSKVYGSSSAGHEITRFMEPEGALKRSQKSATGHYPESLESNPYLHTLFL
jgi:hypothetical protein